MSCHSPNRTALCCSNSHCVGGQRPLEGFDGDWVLEILSLIEVVALSVLQVPAEGELVPLDLSDGFPFANIDLLQTCSRRTGRKEAQIRQGWGKASDSVA